MSWVTVIWSMIAAACLTLAAVHLLVWQRNRTAWPSLAFSLMAVATAAFVFCELAMLRAQTPEEFGTALRWTHVPLWLSLVSLAGFVWLYLKAGRWWLRWSFVGLCTISLLVNFLVGKNLNYREITDVHCAPFLGEPVCAATGVPNPWLLLGQLSILVLIIFVADASIIAWRRGDRGKVLRVGGSTIFFLLASAAVVFWGGIEARIAISLSFLGIVVLTAYELSHEALRASQLLRELHESEQQVSQAADAANLGIWARDLARDEIWASAKWRELFGFTPTERLDRDQMLQKVHPDDRDAVRHALADAASDEVGYELEFRTMVPDGSVRWIAALGQVEFDARGRPVRTRGACSDITARKLTEQEMLRLRQEIAHVGRVSVMGQLASALAHEINQPLGGILRNAEAAALYLQHASPDLDEIRAIIEDIRKDDQRAGAVIDRMRALLKRQDIDKRPLDVGEVLSDVVALVRPDATARHVKLDLEIESDVPRVSGDRVHLQQVLLNLISNGMDAIDEASKTARRIVVSARREGAQAVEIAVIDSGPGIPADRLEQVFGSFFSTKPKGMGMGLSISRTLIEALGGRLWAENHAGGGARFRLTLPLAQ